MSGIHCRCGSLPAAATSTLPRLRFCCSRSWRSIAGCRCSAGLRWLAGALVKFLPLLAAPALYTRWDWRLPVAFVASIVILYLPYLGVGAQVFGFLSGHVNEEGFTNGSGLFLWSLLTAIVPLPAKAAAFYLPVAALVLIVLALVLFFRQRPSGGDLLSTTVLIFAALVLMSPHYPWYFAWLVPFLCFYPFAAGLCLTCAATYLHRALAANAD